MAVGAGNDRENRDARARRDLARYMFYRANEVIAPIYGMADTAFSDGLYLLEASRAVDDPNLDAAAALGRLVLTVELGDSAVRERAYRDVLDHYFLYPENMFAGEFVSRMAGNHNDVDAFLRVNKALAPLILNNRPLPQHGYHLHTYECYLRSFHRQCPYDPAQ